jgi:hypothetical protein
MASVEEVVEIFENDVKGGCYQDYNRYEFLTVGELRALIAEWRERVDAAEAMIDECEAIADCKADEWEEEDGSYEAGRFHACIEIRDAIAALKGNGDGK